MIKTKRLYLIPLSYEQLIKYTQCDYTLEKELNIISKNRNITPELKEALENTLIPNAAKNKENFLFSMFWIGITIENRMMIGDLCLLPKPKNENEIEIGYGTYEEYQNRGYMTELVEGIINWIKTQTKINTILATTFRENIASNKVLEKNNFKKINESETSFHWKLATK